ncbi:MAG: MucR family transcriptional regulator [Holosporales bacterium]|jgi:predicted transcriptional regulator|nr:MucR family transcriptional regulator [Holosporales bacterium]
MMEKSESLAAQNEVSQDTILDLTIELASAYMSSNPVSIDEIGPVLKKLFLAVVDIRREAGNVKNKPSLTPAVPVEESVHDGYIVCLEDGKKLQMLKRHLSTVYGMTIEQYKERWGLPLDYPVVSPSYARRRSDIAKTTGLGSSGRKKLRVA